MSSSEMSEGDVKKYSAAMRRARELELHEEKNVLRQPYQSQLSKYTNMVKGWQHRWFVLSPDNATLEYYEKEEHKNQRPRGALNLAGASVSPSDEDSQAFIITSHGDTWKLKASSASDRLNWVNRLRACAEVVNVQSQAGVSSTEGVSTSVRSSKRNSLPADMRMSSSKSFTSRSDMTQPVHNVGTKTQSRSSRLADLPEQGDNHLSHDITNKTEIKVVTQPIDATDGTVKSAYGVGKLTGSNGSSGGGGQPHSDSSSRQTVCGVSTSVSDSHALHATERDATLMAAACSTASSALQNDVKVNHEEEVEDETDFMDEDLGTVEHHKSIILSLLQQVKLGMDLTKVVLPTFILEKRSLLEMFADCMCHPELFTRITEQSSREKRMVAFLEWYLTSLHGGRQGSLAKKPYNPIIGETFYCSWNVADALPSKGSSDDQVKVTANGEKEGQYRLYYCAEQVSHHPPVTAFYFECPGKKMYMSASIWTRSKFLGMSLSVVMDGKIQLHLLEHGEVYEFSLPSAYARSILTTPWVELSGDKISISCAQTGYIASVTFHTKPFYGGKLHRVTADVKSGRGELVCRVNGEWNGTLNFVDPSGAVTKVIDVNKLQRRRKRVRPLGLQRECESRRLWQQVTEALRAGDTDVATSQKKMLEERQRKEEKQRKELNLPFPTKLFHKPSGAKSWSFKQPLQDGQREPSV